MQHRCTYLALLCVAASCGAVIAVSVRAADAIERTSARTPTTPPGPSLRLDVSADPVRQESLAANYVAIVAVVTDAVTGQPVVTPYALRAGARDVTGAVDPTTFHLAYPYGDDPTAQPGRYTGVVIVPRGGTWTIVVSAFDRVEAETKRIPRPLATGDVTVDVDGGTLLGDGERARQAATRADFSEVFLRILHVFLGMTWFALAGVLALVGWRDRIALTGTIGGFLERNVRRLSSALLWTTATMWLSGLLNLKFTTAFSPPYSSEQAAQVFRAPYARPYIYTLYLKIGVYALLSGMVVPIIRRAATVVESHGDQLLARRRGVGMSVALLLGGAVILVCVTVLTYVHALSERTSIQR